MIRPATIHDVPRIQGIINSHAELGKMLFRSLAQLYEDLRDFAVYERDREVVGCVGLSILWADLAEVRSLAVDEPYRGRGIGSRLVEWCVDEARRLQIRRLMTLTYEQRFFEKLGFEVVAKETLPLKVWSDCVRCPKRDSCDEFAMVRADRDARSAADPARRERAGAMIHENLRTICRSRSKTFRTFRPDDRHPGLSLTCPLNSPKKRTRRQDGRSRLLGQPG
jgi:amino-acid N-acetyltransferase